MASYGFSFRASTRRGGGAGRLYLRIVHGSDSRSVTTSYRVFPEEWDPLRRRLLIPYGRGERSRELAEYESAMRHDIRRLDNVVAELEKDGPYTVEGLMARYRAAVSGNSFGAFAEKLAREMEGAGNHRTAKAYRTAAARLEGFAGGRRVTPETFTQTLISGFQASLKDEGRSMNTISFYMRTLRAIYHKAIAEGRVYRHAESPFAGVYTGVPVTRKRALTHSELARLSTLDPTLPASYGREKWASDLPQHLQQAVAMFLFCFHARGMCFVDMANLRKNDLRGGSIRYSRRKTGQLIEIRMLPAMQRIIDWFAPITTGSEYIFPVINDPSDELRQYENGLRLQNMHLKQIATLCRIGRGLSTHMARHSWATVAKNAGLPLAVISEGLGHSNQRTTEIYLASLDRSVLDHASRLVSDTIGPAGTGKGGGTIPSGPGFNHAALR